MDINASTMTSVYTALSTIFNNQLAATETHYKTVAMTVPSTTAGNEYPKLDDLPGIREWVGDRVVNSLSGQTYTIKNRKFESTIGIARDKIEDDQLGIYTPVVAQIGQDTASFPDELIFPLLKDGDKQLCYDGQYFFDTDHPGYDADGKTASVSNKTPGDKPAWYLIDDTKVIKPLVYQERKKFKFVAKDKDTDENVWQRDEFLYGVDGRCNAGFGLWQLAHKATVALTADNYAAVRAAMMSIRKRNGQVIAIRPAKLLVPPSLEGAARRLLLSDTIDGTTNEWVKSAEVVVIPQLA